MKKILIHGFPHCGTTILKETLGQIEEVYDAFSISGGARIERRSEENSYKEWHPCSDIGPTETKVRFMNSVGENKKYILLKFPWTANFVNGQTLLNMPHLKDFIKIFVMRNPYYIFSSINKRFNYNIPGEERLEEFGGVHSVDQWRVVAELFLKCKDNPYLPNVFCIKYEDFFPNDYQGVKHILNELGIKHTNDIFHGGDDSDKNPPADSDHLNYRKWQLRKKFKNMNYKSKISLSSEQIERLSRLGATKKLGYDLL
tara:strand:+ start:1437 stop:2207 length:771 start_codon:yes stop_codon:yes gene_type:complete